MKTQVINHPDPTVNRLLTLAVNDDDIDHMIHLLSTYPDEAALRIIRQLKNEQQRLFYPIKS